MKLISIFAIRRLNGNVYCAEYEAITILIALV